MDFDDFDLTPEEIDLYFKMTQARIKHVENKALHRLANMQISKEYDRFIQLLKNDKGFRDFFITVLIISK